MQIGGGLGEEYMRAPALPMGGGGGEKGSGGFIANLLDLLGIHRQVAKGPKPEKGGPGVGNATAAAASGKEEKAGGLNVSPEAFTPGAPTAPTSAPPMSQLHVLDSAEQAFSAIRPRRSQLGFKTLPNGLR